MKRNVAKMLVVTLLLGVLSGCATVMVRDFPSCRPQRATSLYPATSVDATCIVTGGGNLEGDTSLLGYIVLSPFWILDLPVSLVTDTILLPNDLRWKKIYEEEASREFTLRPSVSSTNAIGIILVSTSSRADSVKFRLVPSGKTVTVKEGESLLCPETMSVYKLIFAGGSYVTMRREKK
jgi:uncharacterized protein YceK